LRKSAIENIPHIRLDAGQSHGTVSEAGANLFLPLFEQYETVTNVRGKTRMVQSRLGFKALGLCALVLGLMAIAANGAQAEAGAKWTVASTDAGTLKASVQLGELTGTKKAVLSTEIGKAKVKFLTSVTPQLIGVSLEGTGKLTTGGKVKFTGIDTELKESGTASAVCKPYGELGEKEASLGEVVSRAGKGELYLHSGAGVTKVVPETGNVFGTLYFGEFCSLPEEVPVITRLTILAELTVEGKKVVDYEVGNGLVLKEPLGKLGTEETSHEISELAALTELWAISETTEHKATVEGSATVVLSGIHSGLKWKGTPG
jgi:hypothetical protein